MVPVLSKVKFCTALHVELFNRFGVLKWCVWFVIWSQKKNQLQHPIGAKPLNTWMIGTSKYQHESLPLNPLPGLLGIEEYDAFAAGPRHQGSRLRQGCETGLLSLYVRPVLQRSDG